MRRFFALVLLSLYVYNIVGYLAVFAFQQRQVRGEIKKLLKASIPESELVTLAFYTPSLESAATCPIQWIENHEFSYKGSLYDITRSYTASDTTYFICINDVQEEKLFEHLDNHVQRHMGDSGKATKLDLFKDVFKDSLAGNAVSFAVALFAGIIPDQNLNVFHSAEVDPPFHPPRLQPTTC